MEILFVRLGNEGCEMTYEQAHQILDQHREGRFYTMSTINSALQLTGDLSEAFDASVEVGEASWMEGRSLAHSQ